MSADEGSAVLMDRQGRRGTKGSSHARQRKVLFVVVRGGIVLMHAFFQREMSFIRGKEDGGVIRAPYCEDFTLVVFSGS
jgi:hypothetical protein